MIRAESSPKKLVIAVLPMVEEDDGTYMDRVEDFT